MDLETPKGRKTQGDRILRALREAGLATAQAARQLGVAVPTLNAYISGRILCPQTKLLRIARLTGKPPAYFLETEEAQDERARTINEAYRYVWRLRFRAVTYDSHHQPPADPSDIQGLAARLDYVRLYEKAEGVKLLPDDI